MPRKFSYLLLVLLGIAALTLAACGDDDDDDDDATTPTATATEDNGGGGSTTVNVSLAEFEVDPDESSVAAGEVEFVATNDGSLPHELVVVRSDAATDALPVDGGLVTEAEIDIIGEIEEFPASTSQRATFNLEAGRYLLICNVAGHYEAGMSVEFTVE